jgi:hypothetical protein
VHISKNSVRFGPIWSDAVAAGLVRIVVMVVVFTNPFVSSLCIGTQKLWVGSRTTGLRDDGTTRLRDYGTKGRRDQGETGNHERSERREMGRQDEPLCEWANLWFDTFDVY